MVVVLSVYVPLPLAVKVPLVVIVPVTGILEQPRLKYAPSRSPASTKHDDGETIQVPTTEPPHGATSGGRAGATRSPGTATTRAQSWCRRRQWSRRWRKALRPGIRRVHVS